MPRPKTIVLPGDLTLRCDKIIAVRPEARSSGRTFSNLKVSDGSSSVWSVDCGNETKGRAVYQQLVDIMEAHAPAEPAVNVAPTPPTITTSDELLAALNARIPVDVRDLFGAITLDDLKALKGMCSEDPPEYYPAAELVGSEPRLKLFLAADLVRRAEISVYTLIVGGPLLYGIPGAAKVLEAI